MPTSSSARQAVEGAISGQHRSPHKGFSVEFALHREYAQGDEVRRGLKVFAKTDRYYASTRRTTLRATLLVDASGSMAMPGRAPLHPRQYVAVGRVHCAYHPAQRDSVGLITFDTGAIPPRSSTRHLRIQDRMTGRCRAATDLSKVFHEIKAPHPEAGMVFILSDCYTDVAWATQFIGAATLT